MDTSKILTGLIIEAGYEVDKPGCLLKITRIVVPVSQALPCYVEASYVGTQLGTAIKEDALESSYKVASHLAQVLYAGS